MSLPICLKVIFSFAGCACSRASSNRFVAQFCLLSLINNNYPRLSKRKLSTICTEFDNQLLFTGKVTVVKYITSRKWNFCFSIMYV